MNLEHSIIEPNDVKTPRQNAYEAPAIESVLTPESLEREVLYAGAPPASQIPG